MQVTATKRNIALRKRRGREARLWLFERVCRVLSPRSWLESRWMSSSATEQTYPNIAYELQKNTQTKNVFPLTAMEKFWTIPELVARTIRPEFLSRQALYSCSLVSKSLSHHALAAQYQSGVSIMNWLGLLAPLVPSETPNTHETVRLALYYCTADCFTDSAPELCPQPCAGRLGQIFPLRATGQEYIFHQ